MAEHINLGILLAMFGGGIGAISTLVDKGSSWVKIFIAVLFGVIAGASAADFLQFSNKPWYALAIGTVVGILAPPTAYTLEVMAPDLAARIIDFLSSILKLPERRDKDEE